ncbi:hypothetical protein [Enterobacter ludwigii]|uniref:hypothetical protein n=1 Tax=Enterobacter ludwigii TaxID=299767 RepID=UPI003F71161F
MNDLTQLSQFAKKLEQAVHSEDWPKVQQLDQQIMQLLNDIKPEMVSPSFRLQLSELMGLYLQFYQYSQQQCKQLEDKMALFRKNRDGKVAYAMFSQK